MNLSVLYVHVCSWVYNRNSISEVIVLAIVNYGLNFNNKLKHHACRFITIC